MISRDQSDRPTLRTDAERNRTALVTAAREVFAEHGLEVSMAEVARRAGVGMATLYRRFPTREALVVGVFDDKMSSYLGYVERALADPDPWHGFCRYVDDVCAMQHADRGFANVLTMTFPDEKVFEGKRVLAFRRFEQLIDKAKKCGRLRPEFRSQDLVLLLMANAGVVASTGEAARTASQRLVSYVLAAFDAQQSYPLAPPPSTRAMEKAMRNGTCRNS